MSFTTSCINFITRKERVSVYKTLNSEAYLQFFVSVLIISLMKLLHCDWQRARQFIVKFVRNFLAHKSQQMSGRMQAQAI